MVVIFSLLIAKHMHELLQLLEQNSVKYNEVGRHKRHKLFLNTDIALSIISAFIFMSLSSCSLCSECFLHFYGIFLEPQTRCDICFSDKDYENAIKYYTEALELNPSNAIYYSNRSLAYLRTECYGYALADATKALEIDKNYIKGYYRRATSNMALGKFKAALKDYETVRNVASFSSCTILTCSLNLEYMENEQCAQYRYMLYPLFSQNKPLSNSIY